MSTERVVYAGLLAVSAFWALLSGIFLLASPYGENRRGATFWAATFVVASLASAWCFWELFGGAA